MNKALAIVHAWLVLDFFGDARRTGGAASSLTTTIFTQSFLALVFAALLYPETPPVPFAAANLCLSTLLVAAGMLGDDDHYNRRRTDRTLLGSAPLRASTLVLARCGHAGFYVALVTIGMALPPAILLACLQQDALQAFAYVALACACSGLATGTIAVVMRLLDRLVGHLRATLVGGTGKAVLLGGGVVLFALGLQQLQGTAERLPIGRLGAELLPPYQSARLLANPTSEGWRLLPLLGGALVLLALGSAIGETGADGGARAGGRPGCLRWLLRRIAGRGPRLAIAEFVAVSMWRSPSFRSRVLPLLGLPAGAVLLTLLGDEKSNGFVFVCLLLQMPAMYLPFVIAFLPRAEQPDTSWLFEHAPPFSLAIVQDATWRALIVQVLLPVHALALGLLLAVGRAGLDAVAASLFALGAALLASRPMLRSLQCVPFTQSRDAAAAIDLGTLFAAALLLGGAGTAFAGLLGPGARWIVAAAVLAAGVLLVARRPGPKAAVHKSQEPACAAPPATPAPITAAGTEVGPAAGDPAPDAPPPTTSLGRELRAIVVLYAAVCVLPALIGTLFAA